MRITNFKNWWIAGLKGVLAVIFGFFALFYPSATLYVVSMYFGFFLIAAGILLLIASLKNLKRNDNSKYWLIEGILDIVFGLALAFYPETSAKIIFILIAGWAIAIGIMQLLAFFRLRKIVYRRYILLINSLLLIIFGLFFLFNPIQAALTIITILGIFSIIFGIFYFITAIKVSNI